MLWEEDSADTVEGTVSDDVVDLSFRIECKSLPFDHAWALSEAVVRLLPWLPEEPRAGLHLIHGAGSGNGWIRADGPDDIIYLSRRTRFYLRLPAERVEEGRKLSGFRLQLLGRELRIGACSTRKLSAMTTIFTRYLSVPNAGEQEEAFLAGAHALLQAKGVRVKKMLSGRSHLFTVPDGTVLTRSLMLDGLSVDDSLKLQREGLGPDRQLGFGLFLPHKGVDAVRQPDKK
jgi:CRISPR-associated protein Cas6